MSCPVEEFLKQMVVMERYYEEHGTIPGSTIWLYERPPNGICEYILNFLYSEWFLYRLNNHNTDTCDTCNAMS